MKNTTLSTAFLGLITVLLAVLAVENLKHQPTVAQAAPTAKQQWEYKQISIVFGIDDKNFAVSGYQSWTEDGNDLPLPVRSGAKLAELGAQGWELIAVTPYSSSYMPIDSGKVSGAVASSSGLTTDEVLFLKRPKQ